MTATPMDNAGKNKLPHVEAVQENDGYSPTRLYAGKIAIAMMIGDSAETEEWAVRLAHCVNVHDELVAALEKIRAEVAATVQVALSEGHKLTPFPDAIQIKLDMIDGYAADALLSALEKEGNTNG